MTETQTETENTLPVNVNPVGTEHEFFAKTGPLPIAWEDGRRFPRFHFRSCIEAVVYPPDNDPSQEPLACQVLTRDISRGGMQILHKAQLFPGQNLDVVLQDGMPRRLEVMWCRRLGSSCYSAGCRFVRTDGSSFDEEPSAG
ncbi:MAG: PilZ domain-containing protein [Pirellulaceae bacterium]